jgi:hypothetical protein
MTQNYAIPKNLGGESMTKPVWYPDDEGKNLIADFILWFSRIEYALKSSTDFSYSDRGNFYAGWKELKDAIANDPIPEEIEKALLYIKGKPPLKQTGANKWDTIPECADWDLLIQSLKTVRNNLFHGGKHHTGPFLEPARDKELLRYCLSIMKAIVPLMQEDVKRTFG